MEKHGEKALSKEDSFRIKKMLYAKEKGLTKGEMLCRREFSSKFKWRICSNKRGLQRGKCSAEGNMLSDMGPNASSIYPPPFHL